MLRLPTGIYYARGVKANVLFFRLRAIAKSADVELDFVREGGNHEIWTLAGKRLVIPTTTSGTTPDRADSRTRRSTLFKRRIADRMGW